MNEHPEPDLPSEQEVTYRRADAVASGFLPPLRRCADCGDDYVTEHHCSHETITEEAQRLVLGDRQDDYGHPADDFARTGRIWGAILGIPDVPPELVALCMVGVKMSREVNSPKRDNRVDGIGYWLTDELIHQRASQ